MQQIRIWPPALEWVLTTRAGCGWLRAAAAAAGEVASHRLSRKRALRRVLEHQGRSCLCRLWSCARHPSLQKTPGSQKEPAVRMMKNRTSERLPPLPTSSSSTLGCSALRTAGTSVPPHLPLACKGSQQRCPGGRAVLHPPHDTLAHSHALTCCGNGLIAAPPSSARRTCCVSKSWGTSPLCAALRESFARLLGEVVFLFFFFLISFNPPEVAGAKRKEGGRQFAALILSPPALGGGCAPSTEPAGASRAAAPLTLSLLAGLGVAGRLHSEHVISSLPPVRGYGRHRAVPSF